ncbi:hypothetical protein CLV24_11734 [Pontibacter ummariensis]|uniref:Uncharacterized protein n=1 Tax=Pontibacter ummariensis TaxID=1610492 RepID=A0A239IG07_9BACT|nr:hypothetical protein [Pontibacter ummariensis]PRY09830.1 hypothetical protein CLV24_11734 [Pontibacter ummariensis]SNS92469.1 hypothetical protein SAMN06296052_11734 [Pontibacter ummariensis]
MNEEDKKEFKRKLMEQYWVEDRHHMLAKKSKREAKSIVESFNESEVYQNVNIRQYQEDYISDYLMYLWEISKPSFWAHTKASLDLEEGLLWGGDMPHFKILCTVKIPDDVYQDVLNFAVNYNKGFEQDLEAIGCVVRAQVVKFNRLEETQKYIALLDGQKQEAAHERIREMLQRDCPYTFF